MPALPKPHRIAILVPDVKIEGHDAAYEREAAVLLWTACIEVCQRHPRLAVLDADATPLFPQDAHFAPQHAGRGGRPTDAFFGPTRRDEVIWLELALTPRPGVVRLHAVGRDGKQETFDALGRNVGEQIQQVLGAWLTARALGTLPRRFEPVTVEELLVVLRVIAPTLAEQARAWSLPVAASPTFGLAVVRGPDDDDSDESDEADLDEAAAAESTVEATVDLEPVTTATGERRSIARPLAARLPVAFRVPALRLLELALREDLTDLLLAAESDHPQALLAQLERPGARREVALLRRVMAVAPGWARPYELLQGGTGDPLAPSPLEEVAAAGVAALCRPANLDALATAATCLADDDRGDEGLRLLERAVALDPESPRAHLALLDLHRRSERVGAWLAQSLRSAGQHGCPMDPGLPWYPDQIQIDLRASVALLHAGRLDEAIALRANRLAGREAAWPGQLRVLEQWRGDPRVAAASYAREGAFRGDEARTVEGLGRAEPADGVELAMLLDALLALGHEDEAPLVWARFGAGRAGDPGPTARLTAARALMAAGEWRRGLEELWRVELRHPGRDDHPALACCALVMAATPIDVIEAALAERIAIGAPTLARRMARDAADFVPTAAKSGLVARALGRPAMIDFDPDWLGGFAPETHSRRAIDALFAKLGPLRDRPPSGFDIADELQRGDRLVNRWLEVAFTEAAEDDPPALARAAAYTAAQALGRYLAATTAPPSTLAGALRTVAGEALALVRKHRAALGDREARAVLATIEPLLRRVDRWIGMTWLGTAERCLGLDERSHGDVAGFARESPTVAARLLGPEETAVLSWSVARLARERPPGWAARVVAQAARLASHTGYAGAEEWAEGIAAQLALREIDLEDAVDALHTACYLAEGKSPGPCVHAARVLFDAGRAPAALAVMSAGLGGATPAERDRALASLAGAWRGANLDVPFEIDRVAAAMLEALDRGELARAEKLGRWAVAYDPTSSEAHRNLGLALARQGKVVDALAHLARGTGEQATRILASVLYQAGKLADALAVLEHASRWYTRAEPWLGFGDLAHEAADAARTAKAYGLAYQLDPDAFAPSQLDAYAGVLAQLGDPAACERVAEHLARVAGSDPLWQAAASYHRARALLGRGQFDEAAELAQRAVEANPLPAKAAAFAAMLEAAKARTALPPPPEPVTASRPAIYGLLEAGEHAAAAARLADPSWRVRRAALRATRFRTAAENHVEVTPRARAAAVAVLGDSLGTMDREGLLARALALRIREQAYFARDPVPRLGDRMTREMFARELRARGAIVLGEHAPAAATFVDRVIVEGAKVARASDYIALLRDLAALPPREALAQFDLDDAGYLEVARAWAAAMEADPTIAKTIAAGLAKR